MDVTVRSFQRTYRIDTDRVRRMAEKTLRKLGRLDGSLAVVFVSSRKIRELNRLYRAVEGVTDVLAFQLEGGPSGRGSETEMGVVVIAAAQAARQADGANRPLAEEIDLLVVHGVLHLAGFDHGEARERRRMERLQEKILGDGTS